jgi:predicted AAA+ superfamily ATPase
MKRYFERDIYKAMLKWKERRDIRSTPVSLEVSGPRQCGKTTVINKFAEDNYKNVININLGRPRVMDSVNTFRNSDDPQWSEYEQCINFISIFEKPFVDSPDTVIVIDEIQVSPYVYGFIRPITRNLKSHLIVTGSYLGRIVMSDEFFIPAGDLYFLKMNTFSFEEFLDVFDKRKMWESLDLFGSSSREYYDEMVKWFNIYLNVGGYPVVIEEYLRSFDFEEVKTILNQLTQIFAKESIKYLKDIEDINIFSSLFESVAHLLLDEKRGTFNLSDELTKIMQEKNKSLFSRKSVMNVANWLIGCGVLSQCSLANNCSLKSLRPSARLYFTDLGIARLFFKMASISDENLIGVLLENFVFINLCEVLSEQKLTPRTPAFGMYGNGEIDFILNSEQSASIYAIEVKSGKNKSKTADVLLNKGIINKVLFARGNTYGGVDGNKITIPVYLFGRYDFNEVISSPVIAQKMTAFD